ncbi:hypothetical protein BZG29_17165 [Janthinobacterium sp. LM6]|uniref:hypothetical protein n=1 Tax=Janthinobacterium sp. LM6 TaxID=1938606 RepID=UPI000983BC36|nr:hypothetical protein [Janthinobacterium sp. LM6]AQR69862.1 hypothetical protein BZG29_17165 [Janthinobacterium sp. LM6]
MRISAEALWEQFEHALIESVKGGVVNDEVFDIALGYMQSSKLLYGLALENALKAEIVEINPEDVELKIQQDGAGKPTRAHIKSLGVSNGHDLIALAEKAGIFGPKFSTILIDARSAFAFREVCRHLMEMVVWQGRYPVPMTSKEPVIFDRSLPSSLQNHYIRDILDPMLDALQILSRDMPLSLPTIEQLP